MQRSHAEHNLLLRAFPWLVFGGIVVLLPIPFLANAGAFSLLLVLSAFTALLTATLGAERVGHGLLLLAFALAPLNGLTRLGFLQLSDVLFALGSMLLLGQFATNKVDLPVSFSLPAIPFFTLNLVSAAALGVGADGWHHTADVLLGVVLVPALVVWWRPSARLVKAAAVAYIIGNCFNVIDAISQGGLNGTRVAGYTTHPNAFGTCCAIAIAMMPFLWAASNSRLQRWLILASAAFTLLGLSMSGSRAAVVAVVLLTMLFPLLARSTMATLAVASLSIPTMLVVAQEGANPKSTDAIGRLLGGGDSSGSNDARVAGLHSAFNLISHHPVLGTGWSDVWGVHDIYLEAGAAIGVIGLACFAMMMASALRPVFAVGGPYKWLGYPAVAAGLIGFVDPAIGARYIWEPLALGLCAARLAQQAARPSIAEPARATAPLAGNLAG